MAQPLPPVPDTSTESQAPPLEMGMTFVTIFIIGTLGFLSIAVIGLSALVPLIVLLTLGVGFNLLIGLCVRYQVALRLVDRLVRVGNLTLITAGIHFSWGPRSPFLPLFDAFVIVAALRRGKKGARQSFGLTLLALAVLGALNWPLDGEAALRLVFTGSIAGAVALGAGLTGQRQIDARRETERRNRELAALLAELERLLQKRDEFIQNAAHDLRNPLTYLQSYTQLLLDGSLGPLTPEQRRAVGLIEAKTHSLAGLINDIAVLQTAEATRLRPTRLDLARLVTDLIQAAQMTAQSQRVDLRLVVPTSSLPIEADSAALEQIVDNLVSNAIKYSVDGGVVTVRLDRVNGHAHLVVEDEGIGLSEEEQERLFNRFYRAPTARRLNIPGTGLGLSIVKQLTNAHNGQVWVESEPSRGSSFHVTFPLTNNNNNDNS